MKWLGMAAVVTTLAAVVLNSIWFATRGGIPFLDFVRLSIPTLGYLVLFLAAVFAFGWLSARIMGRQVPDAPDGAAADGENGEGEGTSVSDTTDGKGGENRRD